MIESERSHLPAAVRVRDHHEVAERAAGGSASAAIEPGPALAGRAGQFIDPSPGFSRVSSTLIIFLRSAMCVFVK